MIDSAKECGGLYYLNNEDSSRQNLVFKYFSVSLCENNVMLWHYRLGHPSFPNMKNLFSSLYNNKDPSSFQCVVCQVSKHIMYLFQPSHVNILLLSIIHNDI